MTSRPLKLTLARVTTGAALVAGCSGAPDERPAAPEPTSPPAPTPAPIADWPQWRGRDGQGVSREEGLPVVWSSAGPSILWKAEVPGVGNSSPIVSGGQVVLTTAYRAEGPGKRMWRVVLAYDFTTGEELWKTEVSSTAREPIHRQNTRAAPTAVADGEHYFAYFGNLLVKVDRSGGTVWQKKIDPGYHKYSRYGAASSPVLTDDAVIVVQDKEFDETEDLGWLAAFDKETGEPRWRREWEDTCCSYSTPLVVERGGQTEIIFAHSGFVRSYRASDGETLWTAEVPIGQLVSSPMLDGDVLGVSGGAHHTRHTRFFRLVGAGKETQAEMIWETPRYAPQVASPILYNGLFFTVTNKGLMACFDATSGELRWRRRLENGQNPVSLVAGDGKVFVVAATAWTQVIAAEPQFQLLASNNLDEPMSNASPAIVDGSLLIRTAGHLYRIVGDDRSAD